MHHLRWHHQFQVAAALMLPTLLLAQQKCDLPDLQAVASDDPKCLFFSGTKQFREKNYPGAVVKWQRLLQLPELPAEFEHYRVDAYNNLGFLYYMGWGVSAERERALQYWTQAYKAGHEEATYHLCHFYGEPKEPEYRPATALSYCKEALRRYKQLGDKAGENEAVIKQVNHYLSRLEPR